MSFTCLAVTSRKLMLLVLLASCAAPRPADEVASRFVHRVPISLGEFTGNGTDGIEVTEVWGTRPRIEIGGEYVVRGRYSLQSTEVGLVTFFLTANEWRNAGPIMDLQEARARGGEGTFTLQHKMAGPGAFHVTLYNDSYVRLADQYFGNPEPAPTNAAATTTKR